jgi:glycosyltransferase involved in cell wall biosynthesis/SAM-dependent methyltransferase
VAVGGCIRINRTRFPLAGTSAGYHRGFVNRRSTPTASTANGRPVTLARFPLDEEAVTAAAEVLQRTRVAIFIVAFQAEHFIADVLDRIPPRLRDLFAEILVIDDSSSDLTFETARLAAERMGFNNVTVLRTPFNRGYGGNQKLGYLHAIKQGFDYVVLLHGDGQYAPEYLPQIVTALGEDEPDALIASRMINRRDALRGGMPLYKWVGNQILTTIENRMLGSSLSEFHSGYRAYKVEALRSIKFQLNSDDFHFDTEVLIQLLQTGRVVKEIPVPTFYGDEISRVNGLKYAANCLKAVSKVRLGQAGLFYEPKFDFGTFDESGYRVKQADNTLHHEILSRDWPAEWRVADLGSSRGVLSAQLAQKVAHVTSADVERPSEAGDAEAIELDLDGDFDRTLGRSQYDCVLVLDVLEHLKRPEEGVRKIAEILKPGGTLYASTGNIAFLVMRLSLILGQFNYGKRGILDLTHTRLFTIYSFKKLLANGGFVIKEVHGFGPPIRDMVGASPTLRAADATSGLLARLWPRLFAFSFLIVAEKADELEDIYARTLAPTSSP